MKQEQCVFFLIRYFADPIKDEPVNIGVILFSVSENLQHPPIVRFTSDWRRILCVDPDADIEMLSQLEECMQAKLTEAGPRAAEALEYLNESLSNSLRLERKNTSTAVSLRDGKGLLTDNFEDEIDRLMALYVEEKR